MSIGNLLLGIWLILVGAVWAFTIDLDIKIIGVFALVVGIVLLVEGTGIWNNRR